MGVNTKIEWCDHSWNPWRGCTRVSEGCRFCYADTLSGRNPKVLGVWGPSGKRVVAAESNWREPVKWDKVAQLAAELYEVAKDNPKYADRAVYHGRPRVFCASLADVFEDWPGRMVQSTGEELSVCHECGEWMLYSQRECKPGCQCQRAPRPLAMDDVRKRLFGLIDATPHLDWLLLTKRPENIARMMPPPRFDHDGWNGTLDGYWHQVEKPRPNVWLGVSVEDQAAADERIPHLLATPAAVRFLSCEPLLSLVILHKYLAQCECGHGHGFTACPNTGGVARTCHLCDCRNLRPKLHWVIAGGESGSGARTCRVEWVRSLVAQCKAAGVPVFCKQLGAKPDGDYYADREDFEARGYEWPDARDWTDRDGQPRVGSRVALPLIDKKGGDPAEWPADLRVREFPEPRRSAT